MTLSNNHCDNCHPCDQELKELSALAYRDTTAENREFWKNELSQAIRDIQQEYDIKVDQIRGEMETFYNLKVSCRGLLKRRTDGDILQPQGELSRFTNRWRYSTTSRWVVEVY